MNQQTIQNLFDDSIKNTHQDQNLSFSVSSPSVSQFNELRKDAGWGEVDVTLAQFSLINSLFHIGIYRDEALLAYGRVIGDGALFFYIKDVVVIQAEQGKGFGGFIMQGIETYLSNTVNKGATVGLLSVKGKESFYQGYGYTTRDGINLGLGMCKFY